MSPVSGPVTPHINSESEHIGAKQCIGYKRDRDGCNTPDLANKTRSGIKTPGQLGFVNTLPLNLERGNKPEGNDEHQDIVDRQSGFLHGMDEIPRLRRDQEELERKDEYYEPERENEPYREPRQ